MAMPGEKQAPDWVKVTDQAGWQPRDSQGEVVYQDQLWLLGGWFNSFEAPPRDVWSSSDGLAWGESYRLRGIQRAGLGPHAGVVVTGDGFAAAGAICSGEGCEP